MRCNGGFQNANLKAFARPLEYCFLRSRFHCRPRTCLGSLNRKRRCKSRGRMRVSVRLLRIGEKLTDAHTFYIASFRDPVR